MLTLHICSTYTKHFWEDIQESDQPPLHMERRIGAARDMGGREFFIKFLKHVKKKQGF